MEPVEQLVFGYRDGHELIAGSREVSAPQLRDVLPHVDASIADAEAPELVGTWIASLERYLLARVWPAPELPRPGAVWAHAVLIGPRELRSAPLTGLPGLLRRPAADRFEGYRAPLPWPPAVPLAAPAVPLARALVWAALQRDIRTGVVLWDEPATAEHALVALLDVMPAAARRGFSFRSGPRARPRGYNVVLASHLDGRTPDARCRVIDARQAPPSEPPEWTKLLDPGESGARQRAFVRRFGDGVGGTPRSLSTLMELRELIDEDRPAPVVIAALIASFPKPDEVPGLRAALLGKASPDPIWTLGEEERLALLLAHQHHFDVFGLGLSERLAALTQNDPSAVLRLVTRTRTSRRAA